MANRQNRPNRKSAGHEKRRAPRRRMAVAVELDGASGQTINVSNSGVFFQTEQPLAPDTPITLSLVLSDVYPMPPVRLNAEGRVVRVEHRDQGLGVAVVFTSCRVETGESVVAVAAPPAR